MLNKVFIRADGSAEIGLGHLVRCLALSHMLKEDFSIHFFSKEIPDANIETILEQGFQINKINSEEDFLQQLSGREIVVLDSYEFDSAYQKKIKGIGSKLVCIDDFHNQYFYADIVINHAPGVTKNDYDGEPYTKYLLGPEYVLLRPEFFENTSHEKIGNSGDIKSMFICFGGSDSKNLTAKVLSWLPSINYSVILVLGNSYNQHNELENVIEERKDLKITVKNTLSAKEIKQELELADLAIVPASGIALETISLNIPLISGYYADNQYSLYKWLKEKGLIFDSKNFSRSSFTLAINEIDSYKVAKQVKKQKNVIDLKSNYRIRDFFNKLTKT